MADPSLNVVGASRSSEGAGGRAVNLYPQGAAVSRGGRDDFWAFLAGPGPVYDFLEVGGAPLQSSDGSRFGEVVEVDGETGLGGKVVRVFRSADGDHTFRFNRVVPAPRCNVCVTLVDYDTGSPIVGEPVVLGGVRGVTDGSGTFCASLPYADGVTVGGNAGEGTVIGGLDHSLYISEPICLPCGGAKTVPMYRKDKWVHVGYCCTSANPCLPYSGRRPGILPRRLYGVLSGFEPATGTTAAQALDLIPTSGPVAEGRSRWVWQSALYNSGAYASCPGCAGPPVEILPYNPLAGHRYICSGWCAGERRAGHGCDDDYDLSGRKVNYTCPPRIQRGKRVAYGSTRMNFIFSSDTIGGVLICRADIEVVHYWDTEGLHLASVSAVRYDAFATTCDTCDGQSTPNVPPKAYPYWPICEPSYMCPCGRDPNLDDWYSPVVVPTWSAMATTPLGSTSFCGPVNLSLSSTIVATGCDAYGTPTVITLAGTVVE